MKHGFQKLLTKDQLKKDLLRLGLEKEDNVAVALSFKSIGYVQGGPNTFIDALLEVVGSKGTIMMNTFTHSKSLFGLTPDHVFDSKKTIPYTGLIPRTLLQRDGSIRSQHPNNSVVAIGFYAKYLTVDHDGRSNPFLPYEKLGQINGKYMCIGLGNRFVAIRHQAQVRANLFRAPIFLSSYYKRPIGGKGLFVVKHPPCIDNLHNIVPIVEEKMFFSRGKVGLADTILVNAEELLEVMAKILKRNPELGLCNRLFCFNCRYIERHLNLYSKIKHPRFFQKNAIAKTAISCMNRLVLSQFRYAIFQEGEDKIIKKGFFDFGAQALLNIGLILLRRKKNTKLKSFQSNKTEPIT
jgi:aminoglycoside 3-N-acetyltransferase